MLRQISVICLSFYLPSTMLWAYSGGTGEPNDPYLIATAEDLIALGNESKDYDKCFVLVADIDLNPDLSNTHVFKQALIAPGPQTGNRVWEYTPFSGYFDGQGHVISHLNIQGGNYLGLFGFIGYDAFVTNIGLDKVVVSGQDRVGGLAGYVVGGHISNCFGIASINGTQFIGGLVGHFDDYSILENSWVDVDVSGKLKTGGLVGACGVDSTIEQCSARGFISGSNQEIGGLVGLNNGSIEACYATTSVLGDDFSIGGLVGLNGGEIHTSWAGGTVNGNSNVGGLVGSHWKFQLMVNGYPIEYKGIIKDCYATARIICRSNAGGLVGDNQGGTILRSYATGLLVASGSIADESTFGGLIGLDHDQYPSLVEHSFWNIETTGLNVSAKGSGLTTDTMVDSQTYLNAGWDLTTETPHDSNDLWILYPESGFYPQFTWESQPEPIVEFNLDEDPNWVAEGQWQFGPPVGQGGVEHGKPDPNGGFTGQHVYGVNLQGDYILSDMGPFYLTTDAIDCTSYHHVLLRFARWLNTDVADYVRVFVDVSNDGNTWHTIWEHTDDQTALTDESWQIVTYDISTYADGQATVYLSWGYEILDDDAWAYSGWNIDDVTLIGSPMTFGEND